MAKVEYTAQSWKEYYEYLRKLCIGGNWIVSYPLTFGADKSKEK